MIPHGRITESAAATKTFSTLRIERRVLTTATRTIAIGNISTVSVGTHVVSKPTILYWCLAALFLLVTFGSMRPDFSFGALAPTGATLVLAILTLVFAALALKRDDKTHYLIISSNDGVISRFTALDRSILEEARNILTDKINRADDTMAVIINFEKGQIDSVPGGQAPAQSLNGSGQPVLGNSNGMIERNPTQTGSPRPRPSAPEPARSVPPRQGRTAGQIAPAQNGAAHGKAGDAFVDYVSVLPAIVEMHRFYARQQGTQHLEQRLSELELLMRAGTPTGAQKVRLRDLSGELSQILQAYPQAVELFDHIGDLGAAGR